MTGLFGDPVKRKGVVADKVGKETYELWIEISFLNVSNLHFFWTDGRDDFPVCRLCLKEMSRTRQDPSDGTTLPCKPQNKPGKVQASKHKQDKTR